MGHLGNKQTLRMQKVRDVKTPTRANTGDAGIDFFVPVDFPGVRLAPGEAVLIPSGILVDVPRGWMLLMENKSGVGSKKKLDRLACVIDHGYQGEVHINLVNNGTQHVIIEPGDKIIQGIMVPIGLQAVELVDKLFETASARGAGGFGSSGDN